MEREVPQELDLTTVDRLLVYDAASGDILVTHDVLAERGASAARDDEASALAMVARDFGDRPAKLVRAEGTGWTPDHPCRIDPASGRVEAAPEPTMTFRDFVAGETGSEPYP